MLPLPQAGGHGLILPLPQAGGGWGEGMPRGDGLGETPCPPQTPPACGRGFRRGA